MDCYNVYDFYRTRKFQFPLSKVHKASPPVRLLYKSKDQTGSIREELHLQSRIKLSRKKFLAKPINYWQMMRVTLKKLLESNQRLKYTPAFAQMK